MKKLSIVIPVYNEEATLLSILKKLLETQLISGLEKELVLVNDFSTDNSEEIILKFQKRNPKTKIIYKKHKKNRGKGAALNTAFKLVTGDIVVVQDADLEYDPEDYKKLFKPAYDNKADAVYGSRFMGDEPRRILYFSHRVANFIITILVSIFTNINFSDVETLIAKTK